MKDIEKIHVLEIAGMVCHDYGIKLADLQSNRRFNRKIVLPRQIIWSLVREVYGPRISLRELGEMFGMKDHATVIHGCKVVSNLCDTDKKFRQKYLILKIEAGRTRPGRLPNMEMSLLDQLQEVLKYNSAVNMKIGLRNVIATLKPVIQ